MSELLPLADLIVDPTLHARAKLRQGALREYQAAAARGSRTCAAEGPDHSAPPQYPLPPVDVFRDPQGYVWLADGFHRAYATQAAGLETIPANIHEGDRRDAVLFACGSNAGHGTPRTQADKKQEIANVLLEEGLAGGTDSEVAELCGVSRPLVAKVRQHCDSLGSFVHWMKESGRQAYIKRDARKQRIEAERRAQRSARAAAAEAAWLSVQIDPTEDISPQDRATRALAIAAEATKKARTALSAAEKAYPEANHFAALIAICQAHGALQDLQPRAPDQPAPENDTREVLEVLDQLGMIPPQNPRGDQPETLPPGSRAASADHQPETLPPMRPASALIDHMNFVRSNPDTCPFTLNPMPVHQTETMRVGPGEKVVRILAKVCAENRPSPHGTQPETLRKGGDRGIFAQPEIRGVATNECKTLPPRQPEILHPSRRKKKHKKRRGGRSDGPRPPPTG